LTLWASKAIKAVTTEIRTIKKNPVPQDNTRYLYKHAIADKNLLLPFSIHESCAKLVQYKNSTNRLWLKGFP
jgi:hypothetical protein